MNTKKFEVEYPKEALEIGEALQGILAETAKACEDGFQAGTDIPQILVAAIGKLSTAIEGLKELPEEFKTAPVDASMAIVAPVAKGAQELVSALVKEA